MRDPQGRRLRWGVLTGVVLAFGALGPGAVPAHAAVTAAGDVSPFTAPIPTVVGPIASTQTSFPFIADGFSVQPAVPAGYEEQEFFFSGTARIYEYTPTGIQVATPCPA